MMLTLVDGGAIDATRERTAAALATTASSEFGYRGMIEFGKCCRTEIDPGRHGRTSARVTILR
jgi:hypothetical protein